MRAHGWAGYHAVRMTATFSGEFLGCKVSRVDLDVLRARLAAEGLQEVARAGEVHVVNGCCVTHEAVRKTRQSVRRALARSADGVVVVTGCAANLPRRGARRPRAARARRARAGGARAGRRSSTCWPASAAAAGARAGRRRRAGAGVPAGAGRLLVPLRLLRHPAGARRDALAAARRRSSRRRSAGSPPAIASSSDRGQRRPVPRPRRRRATARPAGAPGRVEGLERLRLSSIEVDHVDDALVAALARTPALLPHLHVPLQSGSDDVLRRMRRRYGRERYLARVARAREALGDVQVTADVIVGYPGESDDDFSATLDVVGAQAWRGCTRSRTRRARARRRRAPTTCRRPSSGAARRPYARWRSARAASGARRGSGSATGCSWSGATRVARCWATAATTRHGAWPRRGRPGGRRRCRGLAAGADGLEGRIA